MLRFTPKITNPTTPTLIMTLENIRDKKESVIN